jgi:hypothetical protein
MKIKVNSIYRWKDTMINQNEKDKGKVYFIILKINDRLVKMKYLGDGGSVIYHSRSLFKDGNIILVSDGKDSKQPD